MIEQLEYSVRFPPNDRYPLGRAFERDLQFTRGLTAITGANEVGKTLNLELVEFLLFGSKALRGKAEDYKALRASGVFAIRGERYRIERTVRNAALTFAAGGTLAVGTKPVNTKLLQLLGYGLDVFRVANIANQGDAERLSEMLPAERKTMVDKLIGADQIEAIAAWCGTEALGVSREIAGLEKGLGAEPVQPEIPAVYRPAAELRQEVTALRTARDRVAELRAFLANAPVVGDEPPAPTRIPLATLEKGEQILGLHTYDFDLGAITDQQLAFEMWETRCRFVERYFPQPQLTMQQLDDAVARVDLLRDLARLKKTPTITCPCGKPFTTADAEIARVQAALDKLPVMTGVYDLAAELAAINRWMPGNPVETEWKQLELVKEAVAPKHHPSDAKGAVHVSEVAAAISDLGLTGMSREEIRRLAAELRGWQAEHAAYAAALVRRDAWQLQANAARTELETLATDGLEALEELLSAAQVYEAQKATYDRSFADWAQGRDRLTDLKREERSWRNGKQAMNELREDTKSFLVPALSRVASYLLSQMTGGARTRIAVDESFEIEVDGQPLATLSGSGKVCANLALRLGLGRILTNGVFPVFMGDELDASMDEERAGHLQAALSALEGKLQQIIIVTHKQPATPRVIRLES